MNTPLESHHPEIGQQTVASGVLSEVTEMVYARIKVGDWECFAK